MQWLGAIILIALLIAAAYGLVNLAKERPIKAGLIVAVVAGALVLIVRAADDGVGGVLASRDFERVLRMLATVLLSVLFCIGCLLYTSDAADE